MADKGIRGMSEDGFEQLRMLSETTSVIGDPIETKSGATIIPVSRINLGYGSGGMDFSDEKQDGRLGGGSGCGMSMTPVAFLTVSPTGGISLLQVAEKHQSIDRAMNLLPGLIKQVTDIIEKKTGVSAPVAPEEDVDWDAYMSETPTATVYDYTEIVPDSTNATEKE